MYLGVTSSGLVSFGKLSLVIARQTIQLVIKAGLGFFLSDSSAIVNCICAIFVTSAKLDIFLNARSSRLVKWLAIRENETTSSRLTQTRFCNAKPCANIDFFGTTATNMKKAEIVSRN